MQIIKYIIFKNLSSIFHGYANEREEIIIDYVLVISKFNRDHLLCIAFCY